MTAIQRLMQFPELGGPPGGPAPVRVYEQGQVPARKPAEMYADWSESTTRAGVLYHAGQIDVLTVQVNLYLPTDAAGNRPSERRPLYDLYNRVLESYRDVDEATNGAVLMRGSVTSYGVPPRYNSERRSYVAVVFFEMRTLRS